MSGFIAMAQTTPSVPNQSDIPGIEGENSLQKAAKLLAEQDAEQAIETYKKAASWFRQMGDDQKAGEIWFTIGSIYHDQGQYEEALKFFTKSLHIVKEAKNFGREASVLNRMGESYRSLGYLTEALTCYRQAVEIARKLDDDIGEGRNLSNIGIAYVGLGQYKEAFQAYQQALKILKEKHDLYGVAAISTNLGEIYTQLGNYQKALENFQKAQDLLNEIESSENREAVLMAKAIVLTGIGLVYDDRCQDNRFSCLQAIHVYQQALKIQEKIDDRGRKGNTLHNLGGCYDRLGLEVKKNPTYHTQALQFYRDSLSITKEIEKLAVQARTLNNIGEVYIHLSFYEKKTEHLRWALTSLREALEIQQAIRDRARAWATLSNIGWVYERQGKFQDALNTYTQSIELLEQIITSTGGLDEFKVSLGAQIATTYQRAILLLMRMGQSEQAFEFSERARARVLLDQLGNIRIRARDRVDESLLEREHALRLELVELDRRHREQLAKPGEQQDHELIQLVKKQQEQKHNEYEDLLLKIELSNPEYASLVRVEPLSLKDVQQLLNQETTLLSYFVTPDTILAFIITRDSFNTVELSVGERELEAAIANARTYGLPSDPQPKDLEKLYSKLIEPLKTHLSTQVIGIIPHGVLHYLPFAALTDGQRYFSENYTLFSLPSASVLQFLQNKQKSDKFPSWEGSGVGTVLALANGQAEGLPPLHYVEQEVKAIAKHHKTHLLLGEDATEATLIERARTFSMLHLAAHGELNTTSPLFSHIVLSPDKENDGRLEVHEVYGLDLQQTNLVVLSACDTHLGKRSRGDDIIGLTRAFMYAGTPSVIASLWKIDDRATSDFMTVFYKHLKQGRSKAEALQIAQTKTRDRYPHPYYWAAFVLTGDPGITTERFPWLKILIIGLIIAGILVVVLRKLKLLRHYNELRI